MTIIVGAIPNNTPELNSIILSIGGVATSAATLAATMAQVTLQLQAINTKLLTSNRGAAIGVKSLSAGNSVAVTQAVLTRRNALAGATDQFPVPPTPPGI